jgi:protein-S-isoprenylcysteine O-methyltransferase Ste14
MAYVDQLKNQGNWFFRWRSFLPLVIVPLFIIGLRHFTYPEGSHLLDQLWELFCFAIALLGLCIRIYTVGHVPAGTSGRTTSGPKAQELNTTGIYSIVRHPLYFGNFLIWVGLVLFIHSLFLVVICVLAFFLYYERIIIAEETFLAEKFGTAFAQWAEKTPIIIPRSKLWRKPAEPFSWQVVLTREYPGFFVITAAFTAIEVLSDRFYEGKWQLDWLWVVIFCVGLAAFVILRTLKKLGITKPGLKLPS